MDEESKPKQASKIKRFKTTTDLEVKGQQLVLSFGDDVNLGALFPEGRYKLTVMKGSITRIDLKEGRHELAPEGTEEDDAEQVDVLSTEQG
jgi:hypothetical protein